MPCALISRDDLEDLLDEDRRQARATARRAGGARGSRHQRPADGEHLLLAAGQRAAELIGPLAQPGNSVHDALEVRADLGFWSRVNAPIWRFSSTVRRGKIRRPSGGVADAHARPARGRPSW